MIIKKKIATVISIFIIISALIGLLFAAIAATVITALVIFWVCRTLLATLFHRPFINYKAKKVTSCILSKDGTLSQDSLDEIDRNVEENILDINLVHSFLQSLDPNSKLKIEDTQEIISSIKQYLKEKLKEDLIKVIKTIKSRNSNIAYKIYLQTQGKKDEHWYRGIFSILYSIIDKIDEVFWIFCIPILSFISHYSLQQYHIYYILKEYQKRPTELTQDSLDLLLRYYLKEQSTSIDCIESINNSEDCHNEISNEIKKIIKEKIPNAQEAKLGDTLLASLLPNATANIKTQEYNPSAAILMGDQKKCTNRDLQVNLISDTIKKLSSKDNNNDFFISLSNAHNTKLKESLKELVKKFKPETKIDENKIQNTCKAITQVITDPDGYFRKNIFSSKLTALEEEIKFYKDIPVNELYKVIASKKEFNCHDSNLTSYQKGLTTVLSRRLLTNSRYDALSFMGSEYNKYGVDSELSHQPRWEIFDSHAFKMNVREKHFLYKEIKNCIKEHLELDLDLLLESNAINKTIKSWLEELITQNINIQNTTQQEINFKNDTQLTSVTSLVSKSMENSERNV